MDLRRLILGLTLCSALLPFANTFYAGYTAQRQQLIQTTQESNAAYARKLARSTEDFLQLTLLQLAYTAQRIAPHMDDEQLLLDEATRLRLQTKSFNSIAIFNAQGTVVATSPETLKIKGLTLDSTPVQESLRTQAPVISQAFMSVVGNLIVSISQPIFSQQGEYLGAVSGSIYLKQESMLDRLLGEHFYADGSYIYVVDSSKRIIYHPNTERVGQVISGNPVIDQVVNGQAGRTSINNSQGIHMQAGFAPVPTAGWGIITQRPTSTTLEPLNALMRNMLYKTLPLTVLLLLLIWWSARRITKPLRQLANGAQTMDRTDTAQTIQSVHSWYYEAHELKKAMLFGIGLLHKNIHKLNQDVHTDPLTGLSNRRHLNQTLDSLAASQTPFSVVVIDIDHFKRVNDSFGHDVGDAVLKQLAQHVRAVCRADDVPCRLGGEEFAILLPGANCHAAVQVAERLRLLVEGFVLPTVGQITISLGVSSWPEGSADIPTVFKQADTMLYTAKRNGRNQVQVHNIQTQEMASS